MAEVRERRDREWHAIHPVFTHCVGGDFHHHQIDTRCGHDGKPTMQHRRFRCGSSGGHMRAFELDPERSDHGNACPHRGRSPRDQMGHRGLAIRPGYADDAHPVLIGSIQACCPTPEVYPWCGHHDDRDRQRSDDRPTDLVSDDGDRPVGTCILSE